MAEERQLVVDDVFELGQRLSAIQKDPIDKEGWGAGYAHLAALLQVLLDLVCEFAALDARVKQRFIQAQGPSMGGQTDFVQLGLVGEQDVVKRPKLPLLARAAGPYRRALRLRVARPQRKVHVSELDPAVVLGEQGFQRVLGLLTEGTLKIGELDDGDRGGGLAPHPL